MASTAIQCALGGVSFTSYRIRCSAVSSTSSPAPAPQRLVSFSTATPSTGARPAHHSQCCRAAAPEQVPAATSKVNSILCQNCDGNGAVVCSQCLGHGLNSEDHFGGRFKAGTICWLCRGKKQMLCGNCNGAGFMGGFLNTQDD